MMPTTSATPVISLEEFMNCPRDRMEWEDGHLIEKKEITGKTSRIQAKLARYWGNYKDSSGQGGEVYVEPACRTVGRVRCPDIAYLPQSLIDQYGEFKVLPQSFSLIAEIISPTDEAEEVFAKVREYLESGCEEVWLVFPDSQWILVITAQQQSLCGLQDTAATQKVLTGFSMTVSELIR
jgi:Uma2 family endonuclease